ncbi:cytochrome P450 [Pseudofrankia sp. DC12]|uniref:cytochrome P450 n=1 Tax=Pseudofrankia sp. DC12 TaxID=683315 RepID=UPI000A407204|nr:cytochrome P450 [Pseudofrankia sp. DC12]
MVIIAEPSSLPRPPEPAYAATPSGRLLAELFDPANRAGPYSIYTRLRALGPLHDGPFGLPLATDHRDCSAILGNQDWGHDGEAHQLHPTLPIDASPRPSSGWSRRTTPGCAAW